MGQNWEIVWKRFGRVSPSCHPLSVKEKTGPTKEHAPKQAWPRGASNSKQRPDTYCWPGQKFSLAIRNALTYTLVSEWSPNSSFEDILTVLTTWADIAILWESFLYQSFRNVQCSKNVPIHLMTILRRINSKTKVSGYLLNTFQIKVNITYSLKVRVFFYLELGFLNLHDWVTVKFISAYSEKHQCSHANFFSHSTKNPSCRRFFKSSEIFVYLFNINLN